MSRNQPLESRRRIVGPERAALTKDFLRRYQQDKHSIRQIVRDTGRSYGFVHRILAEGGATMRTRGGPHRRRAAQ
ncbi:helix-turn-helix domain-containing protein [Solwaraspora sp. WMMD1047]|uniref:helix-turn-helix domain-containing protein n=1 Tax=Solwaraspora sp. WMMD1047 TaxID=3016102 RepID=UPI002415AD76|nr:helix-turn-helix domain-containing protein [Solwaraspora sp. WMMD1047]MDG4830002.1 helix-turn-helix domain-containing protein [Solwaraspora sp. WMMD1047]